MADSEATLRLYRPADFETLLRIDRACFPIGIAYGRYELKHYLCSAGAHCRLAEVSGEVAGFILTDRSGNLGHIVTLDVLETYRRRGIASLLLAAAEQEAAAQGVERMFLETARDNKSAIALWLKCGYLPSGILKDYYGRGLDAFEMEKALDAAPKIG